MSITSLLDGHGPVTAHRDGDDVVATLHGVPVVLSEDGSTVRLRHDVGLAWSGSPDIAQLERRSTAITLAGPGLLDARVTEGGERLTIDQWVPGDTDAHGLALAVRDMVATVGAVAARAEEMGVSLVPDEDSVGDHHDAGDDEAGHDDAGDDGWGAAHTDGPDAEADGQTDDEWDGDDVASWTVGDDEPDDDVALGAAAAPVPGGGHDTATADEATTDRDPWDLSDLDEGASDEHVDGDVAVDDGVPARIDGPAALRGEDATTGVPEATSEQEDDEPGAWSPVIDGGDDAAADEGDAAMDDGEGAEPLSDGVAATDTADDTEAADTSADDDAAVDTVWGYVHEAIDVRGLTDTDNVVGQLVPGQWYAILQTGNGWAHVVSADGSLEGWADDRRIVRNG